jgi:predicted ATPase
MKDIELIFPLRSIAIIANAASYQRFLIGWKVARVIPYIAKRSTQRKVLWVQCHSQAVPKNQRFPWHIPSLILAFIARK